MALNPSNNYLRKKLLLVEVKSTRNKIRRQFIYNGYEIGYGGFAIILLNDGDNFAL